MDIALWGSYLQCSTNLLFVKQWFYMGVQNTLTSKACRRTACRISHEGQIYWRTNTLRIWTVSYLRSDSSMTYSVGYIRCRRFLMTGEPIIEKMLLKYSAGSYSQTISA